MLAHEILERLNAFSGADIPDTVDTFKAGDPNKSVNRIAFCFTATPAVVRAAHEWGADLLITHEPTYHDHFDRYSENAVSKAKKDLIESTGMAVFRWHDHAHAAVPDIIHSGFIARAELEGRYENDFFYFDTPTTARQIAHKIQNRTGIRHVRIIGCMDKPVRKAVICLGACGDRTSDLLRDTDAELCIAGEISEWKNGCFVRDAAELGLNKSMLLLGHCASERDGMSYLCDLCAGMFPSCECRYFDCGELYTYPED